MGKKSRNKMTSLTLEGRVKRAEKRRKLQEKKQKEALVKMAEKILLTGVPFNVGKNNEASRMETSGKTK